MNVSLNFPWKVLIYAGFWPGVISNSTPFTLKSILVDHMSHGHEGEGADKEAGGNPEGCCFMEDSNSLKCAE